MTGRKVNVLLSMIAGIAAIAFFISFLFLPSTCSLFEMANRDTGRAHLVHVTVADSTTNATVLERAYDLAPGQRIEQRTAPWTSGRDFNFTVTVDRNMTSQFVVNLWQGMRAEIDIRDPNAREVISPCILYDSGYFDNGNPHPLFRLSNPDKQGEHSVRVSVATASNATIFEETYELAPGQSTSSAIFSTISHKEYPMAVTVDNNVTARFKRGIGPHTAPVHINISSPDFLDHAYDGIMLDYAGRLWEGRCSARLSERERGIEREDSGKSGDPAVSL